MSKESVKAGLVSALNNKFENKVANKKDTLDGDYSNDSVSYPTVKAVKSAYGNKKTSWASTPSDSDIPSEKLVKDALNLKVDKEEGKGLFSGSYNDLTNKPTLSSLGGAVTVEQQSSPDTGFASTYVIKQDGVQVGSKINIMKDKMLRSITVETVGATPTTEESNVNLTTGDKYILMVVNTVDNDGTSRLILPITDVFDLQSADETSITLSAGGVFSIKTGYVESIVEDYITAITNAL